MRFSSIAFQPALVFDIGIFNLILDGVLIRGHQVFKESQIALEKLVKRNVPFIFLTNGGGYTESSKAKQLSRMFNVSIDPIQVVLSHSPMRNLSIKYKNENVLIIGSDGCKNVAQSYGFNNIITSDDIMSWDPSIWPFKNWVTQQESRQIPKIKSILVFNDSRDWGRDLQITTDLLMSKDGQLGTLSQNIKQQTIPIYFSNPDFVWSNEFPVNRFGQGAFKLSLKALYKQLTGNHLKYTQFGKPFKITYDYATQVLKDYHQTEITRVYAIGDNPDSDIHGANGHGWHSILVKTGVWSPETHGHGHRASHVVENVLEAVDLVLYKENL